VDGRKIDPAYVFEVKEPSDSPGAWDEHRLTNTIPAGEVFLPLVETKCPLLRK
jgi:branched-chain amino acid transport system substrate-binding protein